MEGSRDEAVASIFARYGVTKFWRIRNGDLSEAVFVVDPEEYERIDEVAVVRDIAALFGHTTKVAVIRD